MILFKGSFSKIFPNRFFNSTEIFGSIGNFSFFFFIESISITVFFSLNGKQRNVKQNRVTPNDQMSAILPEIPFSTFFSLNVSGAMKWYVPLEVLRMSSLLTIKASPKSPNFVLFQVLNILYRFLHCYLCLIKCCQA